MRSRIAHLMAARLVVALGVLGLSLLLVGAGNEEAGAAEQGLYGTIAVAFAATAAYGMLLPRLRRPERLGVVQMVTDVALVSALVTFSGGVDSIFGFLYLPVTIYGALFFGRAGAYGGAGLGAVGHAGALFAASLLGASVAPGGAEPVPVERALAVWGLHSGALLIVALLSSTLARELRVAGERLDASTSDLKQLRSLHRRTVECLTSGLLTVDADEIVTSFNPEAERITGRSRAEVCGQMLDAVLPGARAVFDRTRRGPARPQIRFRDARGEERHLGLSASVLREADGSPGGWVVIFQDVTAIVAMERDLARSQRLAGVGQLAADMAHEIRNPLAAISGSVEMLRPAVASHAGDPEARRLMDIVLREIDRLDALITDFLQYARPAPPKLARVELSPIFDDIAAMCRTALGREVALEVDVPEGLAIEGDATQIRQVVWNLLSNAEQAVREGGHIRLAASPAPAKQRAPGANGMGRRPQGPSQGAGAANRNGGEEDSLGVQVLVADDGPGIAPENLDRIFDPFFTTKLGGTGLGLPTVHRVVESHGGALEVESEPGRGTEFRLWLPRAAGPPPEREAEVRVEEGP